MRLQESLLNELRRMAPPQNGEKEVDQSFDAHLIATRWIDTLQALETAVEAIEDLAWDVDTDGMAEEFEKMHGS
jgi:hypothetical protein